MKKMIFLLVVLVACENTSKDEGYSCIELSEYPVSEVYIGTNCNDWQTESIQDAIDELNDLVCEPMVKLIGYKEVEDTKHNKGNQTISCYQNAPDWWEGGYKGEASRTGEYINLFTWVEAFTSDYFKSLVMHEILHYLGVIAHSEDPQAVMYTSSHFKTEYTQSDADLFCDWMKKAEIEIISCII